MTSLLRWPRRESLLSDAGRQRRMAGQTTARAARPPHRHSRNHWVGGSRGFCYSCGQHRQCRLPRRLQLLEVHAGLKRSRCRRRRLTPARTPPSSHDAEIKPCCQKMAMAPAAPSAVIQPYRVGLPPSKLPRKVATGSLFLSGSYTNCARFPMQFVPIRSTRRQCWFVLIFRGGRAACLRGRFAEEGTVIGSKSSWIGKSVLEGYVGNRRRRAIDALEGCLDCRKAPAAQITNGAHV